jgi:NAD(P)-dependent dehydrogenase (short-subunit alcohol dehydrogenase family)
MRLRSRVERLLQMKNILVTGGNSGIGYATAALAKARGYDVTISGRNPDRVAQAAVELGVKGVVADISKAEGINSLAVQFSETGLDALVNNASMLRFMPITAHTSADYDEFFNTNVRGPLFLIQQLVSSLAQRKGCVTNISSIATMNGLPNASLYAATKGAMDSFTRSLALEFAPQGIRVNCVSPGAIDTPIRTKLGLPLEQLAAIKAKNEMMIPLRRYGRPEEVAHVILAQIEATYVTGAVWTVDGGVNAA